MKDNYGYIRVAAAMPRVHVADPQGNCEEMAALATSISGNGASVIAFPELSITGYTCADLFGQRKLLDDAQSSTKEFLSRTAALDPVLVFGAPVEFRGRLFNCAVVARRGRILGIVPKTYLAGNCEFYEPRWFESARVLEGKCAEISFAGQTGIRFGVRQLFRIGEAIMGVEICQDLWSPVPPSTWAALSGAQLIVNLSASNEVLMKHEYRKQLVSSTASRLFAAYIYCSCGYGESTQDLVWAGSSLICEGGTVLQESERYKRDSHYITADVDIEKLDTLRAKESTFRFEGETADFSLADAGEASATDFSTMLLRHIEPRPFVPQGENLDGRCREILSEQVAGLTTRMEHIRCRKAVIGISGGLDSTLALLVTSLAFDAMGLDRKGIICVTMPGFGTTSRTYNNSLALMDLLGVTAREISIVPATRQHFADIGHDESIHDLTYENSQARERTQILMDIAGKEGGGEHPVQWTYPCSPERTPENLDAAAYLRLTREERQYVPLMSGMRFTYHRSDSLGGIPLISLRPRMDDLNRKHPSPAFHQTGAKARANLPSIDSGGHYHEFQVRPQHTAGFPHQRESLVCGKAPLMELVENHRPDPVKGGIINYHAAKDPFGKHLYPGS